MTREYGLAHPTFCTAALPRSLREAAFLIEATCSERLPHREIEDLDLLSVSRSAVGFLVPVRVSTMVPVMQVHLSRPH
jgi:hypothetical protein